MKKHRTAQPEYQSSRVESNPASFDELSRRTGKRTHRSRRPYVIGGIIMGVMLLSVMIVALYVNSLLNLVEEPEYAGDPTLEAVKLVEADEIVNQPDNVVEMQKTIQEIDNIKKIPIPQDADVRNILLIGTDNRGAAISGRSDTMMILSINKRTGRINLVSLMRGMYVEIPGHNYGMLNAAYAYGGSSLLQQSIEDNFRVPIDDSIAINFAGFVKSIDLLGGLNIKLTAAEIEQMGKTTNSSDSGFVSNAGLVPGSNLLTGEQTLTYARLRKLDSDFYRTGRQRVVIETLLKKMIGLNVVQLNDLARQFLPLVKSSMSNSDMIGLAVEGLKYKNYQIRQLMLPIEGSHRMIIVNKMQVEKIDVERNIRQLHQTLYGD